MCSCRPLLEGSAEQGAWDSEVGGPCAVPMAGGRYRVYYSGRRRAAAADGTGSTGSGSDGRPWEGFGLALNPAEAAGAGQLFEGMRTDFERLVPKAVE
jgi:hypothetical protein